MIQLNVCNGEGHVHFINIYDYFILTIIKTAAAVTPYKIIILLCSDLKAHVRICMLEMAPSGTLTK